MIVELKCIFILRKNFIIKKKGGGLGLVGLAKFVSLW